jgi:hypothetical protein
MAGAGAQPAPGTGGLSARIVHNLLTQRQGFCQNRVWLSTLKTCPKIPAHCVNWSPMPSLRMPGCAPR